MSGGAAHNARESASKRLGVKKADGEMAAPGQIIIRQRGSKYSLGSNVKQGADDTIYAMKTGKVRFTTAKKTRFDGTRRKTTVVSVL